LSLVLGMWWKLYCEDRIKPLFIWSGWSDFKLRYRPVCRCVVRFLMTSTSRKAITLSDCISTVNCIEGLKLLRCLRKFCNRSGPRGQTTNVSSPYISHSDGLCCAESRVNFSKCSMKMLLTMSDKRAFHSHAIFLLEELIVHLKICGSQTSLQQLHDGFDLQDRPFRQCVTVIELISDDLWGLDDWYISKMTNTSKLMRASRGRRFTNLQQLYELARILYNEFWSSGKRTQYPNTQ
jgi:hypothetical protein